MKIPARLLVFFLFFTTAVSPASAWTFDPNSIISDAELRDKDSLTRGAIQTFLERENSALKNFSDTVEGQVKSATQIIWEVGQKYNINPKFLLTTLEKEKGLIQKPVATQKDLDWATGYSCFNNQCNDKYKGFFHQVESTAITQNIYQERAAQFEFKTGVTSQTRDKYPITPTSQATANLYIYTPFIGYAPDYGYTNIQNVAGKFGANFLFWQIWNRYFTDKRVPNGFAITHNGSYWLIEGGKKRKYETPDTFLRDRGTSPVFSVSDKVLNAFPNGPEIYFSNNTLVRSATGNQAYLIAGGTKRPIVDSSALALLPNVRIAISTLEEIPVVPDYKLDSYPVGNPVNPGSIQPLGQIYRDETGHLYWVQDGLKYPLHPDIWKINFQNLPPENTTAAALAGYAEMSPVLIKNGSLVKNSLNAHYFISDLEKIKISDLAVFTKLFGSEVLASAVAVADDALNLHKDGLNIDYIDDTIIDPAVPAPALPATQQSYAGEFSAMSPESIVLLTGQKTTVTMTLKNTGAATWTAADVWLTRGSGAEKIPMQQNSVASGQIGSFTFELTAPAQAGLAPENFSLMGPAGTIMAFGKFILVKTGDAAEIVSHNIPVAVRNVWRPITITMKIKNTSESTIWLSRKTALEIYSADGGASPFYDPNDWVRKEVAAVPLNTTQIKPGETGTFTFTLKPQGLKPGAYALNFKLNLLDKGKIGYLNGQESWVRYIRVDK